MKRYKTNIKNKYIIYLLPFLLVFFFLISGIVLTWSGTALAWCEQGAGGWCHSDSGCSAGYYYCSYDWVMHCMAFCDYVSFCCRWSCGEVKNCNNYDGWGSYGCCAGDTICRYYFDWYCSGGACTWTKTATDVLVDCDDYNGWYCWDNTAQYRDYYCYMYGTTPYCFCNVTSSYNCDNLDGWYYRGNVREYRDYYCSGGSCSYTVTSSYNCNNLDGWYNVGGKYTCCDGNKTCTCQRQQYRDYYCSGGSCTYSVTNTRINQSNCSCVKNSCGADCAVNADCPSYCGAGNVRYYNGTCGANCLCSYSSYDCDNYDGWRNVGSSYSCCDGNKTCTCQNQEYRDYYCSGGSCTYSVTNTRTLYSNCALVDGQCGYSANQPPVAAISCDPSECGTTDCYAYTGCPFHLINNSTDPNGIADIIKSEWDIYDWGTDPDLSCSGICNYTPPTAILTAGTYTVELYVEDSQGASDTKTITFYLLKEALAGFMCSLDNLNWKFCEELKPIKGELVYFKDNPSLDEHSTPSQGATSITSRIWKINDTIFDSDNNPNPSTNLNQTSNIIELEITDNQGRTNSISHTISTRIPLPQWMEIPPF